MGGKVKWRDVEATGPVDRQVIEIYRDRTAVKGVRGVVERRQAAATR